MIFADGVFALGIAFFLTILFVALGRCVRSWRRILVFFAIVFLGSWAGGVWLAPVGSRTVGVYWVAFFVVGLIFALIQGVFAAHPARRASCERPEQSEPKVERELRNVFDVFLFLLLLLFIAAIVIGYIRRTG
jgi:Ca2+/Na+ antiporter